MLYNIYRTLIIIEKSNKKNKTKPKNKIDNTKQTKIKINNETNIILNITNEKQQNTHMINYSNEIHSSKRSRIAIEPIL